jgi:hypothetical protein
VCLLLNLSCETTPASIGQKNQYYKYKTSELDFNLGNKKEFEFTKLNFETDGNGRLLVQYNKKRLEDGKDLGMFVSLSDDGGKTFGPEIDFRKEIESEDESIGYSFYFTSKGISLSYLKDGNLFYSKSIGGLDNWSQANQVNDEQNSVRGGGRFLSVSENELYFVWIDQRRGYDLIFFSSSFDGGKSWTANQPIDFDFREGNQLNPNIVIGDNNRILVFWADSRDRKTLYDIYYSYSDDGGKNWSQSQKLNDDEKEVWQTNPIVKTDGGNIYVTFSDFREEGEEDDNDWNIYFIRSEDNGGTWDKNKRLNDVQEGVDGFAFLSLDKEGNLYCLWESGRENLFGQIVFSYSSDKGENWSPSTPLTSKEQMISGGFSIIEYFSKDRFIIRIGKEEYGKLNNEYLFLEKTEEKLENNPERQKSSEKPELTPIKYEVEKTIFSDDFSQESTQNWEVRSGIWDFVGGTYMGVIPNKSGTYSSFVKMTEPQNYVLSGRFRFDAVAHSGASFYFRTNQNGLRHYVLTNHFRIGTWLSIKDNDLPTGLHLSGGEILAQKRYPFKQDRWYKFRLVVTPEQIDYYVNGRLMLIYKGTLRLPVGKIGVGGFHSSPTYFDDITIAEPE